jgi:two-component system invasion response regulator UvrY
MPKSKASVAVADDHVLHRNGVPEVIPAGLASSPTHLHTMHQPVRSLTMLNDREIEFLKLACTEMTYKEIAEKMFLSARTIDGYRDALFEKLNVRSRVGLAMYAIRAGLVIL